MFENYEDNIWKCLSIMRIIFENVWVLWGYLVAHCVWQTCLLLLCNKHEFWWTCLSNTRIIFEYIWVLWGLCLSRDNGQPAYSRALSTSYHQLVPPHACVLSRSFSLFTFFTFLFISTSYHQLVPPHACVLSHSFSLFTFYFFPPHITSLCPLMHASSLLMFFNYHIRIHLLFWSHFSFEWTIIVPGWDS